MTNASEALPAAARQRMGPALVVTLLALLLGTQPITTDLYLPALPGLAADLGSPMGSTQLTLSALLFAFGLGQLLLGPAADRFGRRPVLLAGLAGYVLASFGSALAPDIAALVGWRALQGLGMAAAVVCARAMVRDLYAPAEGARVMSKALSGLGLLALASPLLGGVLASTLGWRHALAATGVFGALCLLVVALALHETVPARNPLALRLAPMLAQWRRIVRHPGFVAWALLISCTYGGLFAFLAASSFVFIEVPALAAAPRPARHGQARRRVHAGRRREHGGPGLGGRDRPLGDRAAAVRLQLRPRHPPALRAGRGGRALSATRRCGVGTGRLHARRGGRGGGRVAGRVDERHGLPARVHGGRDGGGHGAGGLDAGTAVWGK